VAPSMPLRSPPRSPLFPYTTLFRSIEIMGKCFDTGAEAVIGWPFRDALDHAGQASSNPDFMTVSRLLQMIDREEDTEAMEAEVRSEEHTSELQSRENLVCRLLLEKK